MLVRRFKVHKDERTKWELRCRGCGKVSCFQLYARPEVVDGSEYWVIHNVHLKFECQPKPDNKSRSYTTNQLKEWGDCVIPTAASYAPSSAGGKIGGGTSHIIWDDDSKGRQSPAKARQVSLQTCCRRWNLALRNTQNNNSDCWTPIWRQRNRGKRAPPCWVCMCAHTYNIQFIRVGMCTHIHTGPDRTGPNRSDRTGPDRTGPDRTGPDRTGQDRTGQDRTGQDY